MIASFLLLILGLVLIFLEFYLPGGIMGIAGGIVLLISIINFATHSDNPWEILGFVLLVSASLVLLIRWTLAHIKRSQPGSGIYSWGDQEGYQASGYDRDAIGKTGVVTTDLKPGGHITVEGKHHSAVSMTGYIPKGTRVQVISGEGETLYVRKVES